VFEKLTIENYLLAFVLLLSFLAARNGTTRKALYFTAVLCLFFSMRDLRGPSCDLRELLPHGRKHVQFYNFSPKIWGTIPKKIWWRKISQFERKYLPNG